MKKLLFCALFLALAFCSQAQFSVQMPLIAGDTIVNTGTVTKTLPAISTGGSGIFIQASLTKISGTGAGTAQLQLSCDNGATYLNSGSAVTITNTSTQPIQFTVTAPVPDHIRILFTGSGTESVQVRIWYRSPKYQGLSSL